jgi:hypothetical protein
VSDDNFRPPDRPDTTRFFYFIALAYLVPGSGRHSLFSSTGVVDAVPGATRHEVFESIRRDVGEATLRQHPQLSGLEPVVVNFHLAPDELVPARRGVLRPLPGRGEAGE